MTRTTIKIEDLTPGMTLDTMNGPRRVVGVVGADDDSRLVTVVSRPMGRGGECIEESWSHGTMMRVVANDRVSLNRAGSVFGLSYAYEA